MSTLYLVSISNLETKREREMEQNKELFLRGRVNAKTKKTNRHYKMKGLVETVVLVTP